MKYPDVKGTTFINKVGTLFSGLDYIEECEPEFYFIVY